MSILVVEFKLCQFYLLDFKLRRYNAQVILDILVKYYINVVVMPI
jgi:hypothetical protein